MVWTLKVNFLEVYKGETRFNLCAKLDFFKIEDYAGNDLWLNEHFLR